MKSNTFFYAGQSDVTTEEWSFYPDGYKHGKRCIVSGRYHGNKQTVKEIQLENKMGIKDKGDFSFVNLLCLFFFLLNIFNLKEIFAYYYRMINAVS